MDLSKNHRQALLAELEEALKNKESLKAMLQSESAKNSLDFAESIEIKDFLNKDRIKTIRAAIVDVEIDY